MIFIIYFAQEIFFDDSDDKDENLIVPKVNQYAEEIIPHFSNKTFQMYLSINV